MARIRTKIPEVALCLPTSIVTMRELLSGVLRYAQLNGPWSIHIIGGRDGEQRLLTSAAKGSFSGMMIYMGDGIGEGYYEPWMDTCKTPMVLAHLSDNMLRSTHPMNQKHRVMCDNRSVALGAAHHLLERKFNHFAYVGEVHDVSWSSERCALFRETIEDAGFPCTLYPKLTEEQQNDFLSEQIHLSQWLKTLPKPIAIFAANDSRALQVMDACLKVNIRIPDEVAVLGVDNDVMICETTHPQLSSIQMDTERAGYEAAHTLDQLMRGARLKQRIIQYGFSSLSLRKSTETPLLNDILVSRAREMIRINMGTSIAVSDIVNHLGVSRRLLEVRFKKATGKTIYDAIMQIRLERAQNYLRQSAMPVEEIATTCGFVSASHMGTYFRKAFGMPPASYRQMQRTDNCH